MLFPWLIHIVVLCPNSTYCYILVSTCRKTYSGKCCALPFVFHGAVVNRCLVDPHTRRSWCATTPNFDKEKRWGFCQSTGEVTRAFKSERVTINHLENKASEGQLRSSLQENCCWKIEGQDWRSDECARLPPLWPKLDCDHSLYSSVSFPTYTLNLFLVLILALRVFLRVLRFSSISKKN